MKSTTNWTIVKKNFKNYTDFLVKKVRSGASKIISDPDSARPQSPTGSGSITLLRSTWHPAARVSDPDPHGSALI
jgi:hypothetical protein